MHDSNNGLILTSIFMILCGVGMVGCVPEKDPPKPAQPHPVTQNSTLTNKTATQVTNSVTSNATPLSSPTQCNNQAINTAYQAQNPTQKIQVLGCGQIVKLLKDDTEGSQHQKFLVKIDGYPQITVLIAHNTDLAHRINTIQANQFIRFYGEYIYTPKGGVVHWTHKDPSARHQDGWLDYQGQKYQ